MGKTCRALLILLIALPFLPTGLTLSCFANVIKSGAGMPPPGATDIDVIFSSNLNTAGMAIVSTGTTLVGNPEPTISNSPAGYTPSLTSNAMVTWTATQPMVGVQGWSIEFNDPNVVIDTWYFTKDGTPIPESSSLVLLSFGLLGCAGIRRKLRA